MRRTLQSFAVLCFVVSFLSGSVAQAALLNRVYVSEVDGNDVPSCGPIKKPCQTFAFSVTQVAAGGRVIVLNTGEYGPVTITKSLTIEAPAGVDAEVASTGAKAITVAAAVTDVVVLRGLTVKGPGDAGIFGNTFGSLHIENCVIYDFNNAGVFACRAGKVHVKDTTVRDCGSGIEAGFCFPNSTGMIEMLVEHCRVERTRIGGAISASDGAQVTVRDTTVSSNQFGFSVIAFSGNSAEMTVENSLAFDTRAVGTPFAGGQALAVFSSGGSAVARISNTVLVNNDIGVLNTGGTIYTFGNNKIHGNTQDIVGGPLTPVPRQ
jgi:parallel beta helix pectate lyase-like protein